MTNLQIRRWRALPYREFANRLKFKNVNENRLNGVESPENDRPRHSQRVNLAGFSSYFTLIKYFKAALKMLTDGWI